MLLTQSTAPIIGWVAKLLGFVMEFIFNTLSSFGVENIGLCIIFFTIFVRIILLPLMVQQQKFQKINQAMQPEISKIQKKYRNKKDQVSLQKQNEEIQAVYDKYGTNPTGGCVQLLVQMPILFALYQVIRKVPAYIPQVKVEYSSIVDAISGMAGYTDKVNKIIDGLGTNYARAIEAGSDANFVIDQLTYFHKDAWAQLASAFPQASDVINTASSHIIDMNTFFAGINISQTPGFKPSVYWLIPLLAGLFQYLSTKTMQMPTDDNNPAASMTKNMNIMMPLMSVYFCLIMPAGLGIYWVTSALLQFVQQITLNRVFKNVDLDKLVEKNRAKVEKKKAKGKKSMMDRIMGAGSAPKGQGETAAAKEIQPLETISGNAALKSKNMKNPNEGKTIAYDKLGEIGKAAYSVAEFDKTHHTKGGNK